MQKYVIIILFHFLMSQGVNTYLSYNEKIYIEIEAIKKNNEFNELFIFPVIQKKPKNKLNLIKKYSKLLKLEPIFALRYSTIGFEIDEENTPSKAIWITPGIHLSSQIPFYYNFTSSWFYIWTDFYKHAAYGFNGEIISRNKKLFNYNPYHSIEYYEQSTNMFKGIEFDEGQGGIAFISPSFNIILAKMKSNLGPFFRDNLSISKSTPSFQQIRLVKKFAGKKNIFFTYIFGSLNSNLVDSTLLNNYTDIIENYRLPKISKYVVLHRLDVSFSNSFRLGMYEKLIFGARPIPIEYLNPLIPFWSAQHSLGDLDNLLIGIDFSYLKGKNRFIGSFFMDEWNPYVTFNKNKNRNWFGYQLGLSRLESINRKDLLFKLEYTKLDPRVYNHRFEINEPSHHNYNLGFWTGGHTEDVWFSVIYLINEKSLINFNYEITRIGQQNIYNQYNNIKIDFLNGIVKKRTVYSIMYTYKLAFFDYKISFKLYDTLNLGYKQNKFNELSFSLMYNIPY